MSEGSPAFAHDIVGDYLSRSTRSWNPVSGFAGGGDGMAIACAGNLVITKEVEGLGNRS